jgi:hypothetical protein
VNQVGRKFGAHARARLAHERYLLDVGGLAEEAEAIAFPRCIRFYAQETPNSVSSNSVESGKATEFCVALSLHLLYPGTQERLERLL